MSSLSYLVDTIHEIYELLMRLADSLADLGWVTEVVSSMPKEAIEIYSYSGDSAVDPPAEA
jgi:hypothetical protein